MAKKTVKINLKDNTQQQFHLSEDKKNYFAKAQFEKLDAKKIVNKTQEIYPNLVALPRELVMIYQIKKMLFYLPVKSIATIQAMSFIIL